MSTSLSTPVSTHAAYRRCEAIARAGAANFYYGIRLLSPPRRRAMCAVYAFARRVDDIGDGALAPAEKLRRLDEQAQALARLSAGDSLATGAGTARMLDSHGAGLVAALRAPAPDPVMVALADAYERFAVPPDALQALIEGVRMDVEGVRYESFDDLVLYCRCVAGAIGRACLAIFALRDPDGADPARAGRLADDLGVALQLTNILRDVREDAENGRVYLPAEDLRRFGLMPALGEEGDAASTIVRLADGSGARVGRRRVNGSEGVGEAELRSLDALVSFQADRARQWFERGLALAPLLDRRSAACLLAMAGIYDRLLSRIAEAPQRVLRERVSLGMHEKTWVALRSMFGGSG